MNVSVKRKLVALAVWPVGLGLMSAVPFASALADCTPASIDPSCPLSSLSLSNAANPASPLNPSNPANAQYQWQHSANNPASVEYQVSHGPASVEYQSRNGPGPYVGGPNVLDLLAGLPGATQPEPVGYATAAEPTEPPAPAPRRHHRHRKHQSRLR